MLSIERSSDLPPIGANDVRQPRSAGASIFVEWQHEGFTYVCTIDCGGVADLDTNCVDVRAITTLVNRVLNDVSAHAGTKLVDLLGAHRRAFGLSATRDRSSSIWITRRRDDSADRCGQAILRELS